MTNVPAKGVARLVVKAAGNSWDKDTHTHGDRPFRAPVAICVCKDTADPADPRSLELAVVDNHAM